MDDDDVLVQKNGGRNTGSSTQKARGAQETTVCLREWSVQGAGRRIARFFLSVGMDDSHTYTHTALFDLLPRSVVAKEVPTLVRIHYCFTDQPRVARVPPPSLLACCIRRLNTFASTKKQKLLLHAGRSERKKFTRPRAMS